MFDDTISVRRHGRREIITYDVTPDQLDRLERAGAELGFNFHISLALVTAAASFLASLILSPPPPGKTETAFVSITIFGFLLGIIFGYKWYRDRDTNSAIFREIREQPEIGPLGDERQELQRADLNRLPLEAAPAPPPAPAQAEAAPAPAAAAAALEPREGE